MKFLLWDEFVHSIIIFLKKYFDSLDFIYSRGPCVVLLDVAYNVTLYTPDTWAAWAA